MSPAPRSLLLAGIVFAGGALRLYGVGFGLPLLSNFYVRPDESLVVVPAVEIFARAGDPGYYAYPALMLWICAVVFHLHDAVSSLLFGTAGADLAGRFAADPSTYFLMARLVSVVAGTLAVVLVYGIARVAFSSEEDAGREPAPAAGPLLAAALYATAPLAVRDAHFGVTDTLLSCVAAATILFVLRPCRRGWLLGGVCLGLTLASKFSGFVLAPVAALAILVQPGTWRPRLQRTIGLLGVAGVVFAILNPYLLLRFASAFEDVSLLVGAIFSYRPGGAGVVERTLDGILAPLRQGPGLSIGLFFAGVGLTTVSLRTASGRRRLLLGAAAIVFLVPLLLTEIRPFRYALPALPFLAVLSADGMLAASRLTGRRQPAVAAVLVILAVGPALVRSLRLDHLLAQEDTRVLAGRWIEGNVAADVPVIFAASPECEPQVKETAASIRRRIEYVHQRYGAVAGELISEIYRLQLEAADDTGHEVFRNELLTDARVVCLVEAWYPLDNPACPRELQRAAHRFLPSRVIAAATFESVEAAAEGAVVDRIDAFFLPFTGLEHVERPGPSLRVSIEERLVRPPAPPVFPSAEE